MDFHKMSNITNEETNLRSELECNNINILSDSWKMGFWLTNSIFGFLSIFLNSIVIIAVQKGRALRKNSNRLLYALAITDITFGILAFLTIPAMLFIPNLQNSLLYYEARRCCMAVLILVSGNLTALISVDRYINMMRLSMYRTSRRTINAGIIWCWLLPVVLIILMKLIKDKYRLLIISIQVFMNVGTIVTCYVLILNKMKRNTISVEQFGVLNRVYSLNEKHTSHTIITLISLFICQQLPLVASLLLTSIFGVKLELAKLSVIAYGFSLSNSITNPILYSYRTKGIRADVVRLLELKPDVFDYEVTDSRYWQPSKYKLNGCTTGQIFVITPDRCV